MTPEQLEEIKAYVGSCWYDELTREIISEHFSIQVLDPIIGQFISDAVNEKLERIGKNQPKFGDKIYVENVRAARGITTDEAKFICENQVKNGHWTKHFGITCKNCRRIIESVGYLDLVPISITCKLCDGEDDFTFKPGSRDVIIYYTNNSNPSNSKN